MYIYCKWPWKVLKWPWFGAEVAVKVWWDLATLKILQIREPGFPSRAPLFLIKLKVNLVLDLNSTPRHNLTHFFAGLSLSV
jgi:hypothetical protein